MLSRNCLGEHKKHSTARLSGLTVIVFGSKHLQNTGDLRFVLDPYAPKSLLENSIEEAGNYMMWKSPRPHINMTFFIFIHSHTQLWFLQRYPSCVAVALHYKTERFP